MRTELEKLLCSRESRSIRLYAKVLVVAFTVFVLAPVVFLGPHRLLFGLRQSAGGEFKFSHWLVAESTVLQTVNTFKSMVRYYGFGLSPHKNFYLGENGMFVRKRARLKELDAAIPTARPLYDLLGKSQYTDDELGEIALILRRRKEFLQKRGIPYLVVFIPRKSTIYPEIYPRHLRERFVTSNLEKVMHYLEANSNIDFVNLIPNLHQRRRQSSQPLYFRTDGHWNMLGAFYGYQTVMEQVNGILGTEPDLLRLKHFTVSQPPNWCHKNFYRDTGLCLPDKRFIFKPTEASSYSHIPIVSAGEDSGVRQPESLQYEGENLLFVNGIGALAQPRVTLRTREGKAAQYSMIRNFGSPPNRTAVIFSASFGEKMLYFFANHFQRVIKSRQTRGFDDQIFRVDTTYTGEIDIVIQTIAEGILHKKARFWNSPALAKAGSS